MYTHGVDNYALWWLCAGYRLLVPLCSVICSTATATWITCRASSLKTKSVISLLLMIPESVYVNFTCSAFFVSLLALILLLFFKVIIHVASLLAAVNSRVYTDVLLWKRSLAHSLTHSHRLHRFFTGASNPAVVPHPISQWDLPPQTPKNFTWADSGLWRRGGEGKRRKGLGKGEGNEEGWKRGRGGVKEGEGGKGKGREREKGRNEVHGFAPPSALAPRFTNEG